MTVIAKAVFKTLAYADIFDYPLKKEEIWRWLIYEPKIKFDQKDVAEAIESNLLISQSRGYFFLANRKKNIDLRRWREEWSRGKRKKAQRAGKLLKIIPTIKMVGITGNLAMSNGEKDDDIDLLVVSSAGAIWLTRFLCVFLLEIAGWRRRPSHKKVKDKVCLNMFLDELHLEIPQKEQDLYSAHEVAQFKPLWERDGIYQKFLKANAWGREYLPNAIEWTMDNGQLTEEEKKILNFSRQRRGLPEAAIFNFFERLARSFQLWYMEKRRTTEVISDGLIRFHPNDPRNRILEEFSRRLRGLDDKLVKERFFT